MLPKGWTQSPLRESVRIHSGHAPSELNLLTEGEIPYVKVEDLNNCEKYQTDSREYLSACRSVVPAQALIFPKRGAAIFANKIRIAARPLALDTNLMGVEVVSGLDPEYLYYAISFAGLHRLADTSTIPQLNNKHVLPHVLPRPSLKEQRRVAQILSAWDQAIATSESLLANAQRHMTSLLQQFLIKPAASGEWDTRSIGDVSERIQRRARDDEELPVLMISSGSGFVRQDEKYSRFMAGKSVENYIALDQGEFAYNKGNSKSYEFGCVFSLNTYERGLVPNVYVCFKLSPNLNAVFYEHLFRADFLHDQLGALVNTGVRNNGLLNIKPVDFLACLVPVPPLDVQHRIAEVLTTSAKWVALQERDLELLKQEKAALMPQLLTGKRRVKLPDAEAEVQA